MTDSIHQKSRQDHLLDQARSIRDEIEVFVFGPSGTETPACAEAWSTAKLIAELRARVEALEIWHATTAATTASGPLMTALCSALVNCDPNADLDDWAAEAAAGMANTIANWLDQQELHVAATRLRMEVEQ